MITYEPYQKIGIEFLKSKKAALLADDMGLGKTAQAIRALDELGITRALIICPAIVRFNWKKEFEKFSTLNKNAFSLERWQDLKNWNGKDHLVISYSMTPNLRAALYKLFGGQKKVFGACILDEAHFVKNLKARRAIAILADDGIVRFCNRVWALSGTPMPNDASELYPLLKVFGATKLGYRAFVKKFCISHGGYADRGGYAPLIITGTKRSSILELKEMLAPVMLRRQLSDVLKLPAEFSKITIPKPRSLADDLAAHFTVDDMRKYLDEAGRAMSIRDAEGLMLLAPSVSTLRKYTGLLKVPGVASLVESELNSKAYDKIVIFAHHKSVIYGLEMRLAKFHTVVLDGQTPPPSRQKIIDAFQTDPAHKILIASITAAGIGINLTAATQVLFAEMDWVPANNQQAYRRVLRRGQEKKVYIRSICLNDSLDDRITEILKNKLSDIQSVVDGG